MRHDLPFVVKRLSRPIGRARQIKRRRVAVSFRAHSLASALEGIATHRARCERLRAALLAGAEQSSTLEWYRDQLAWEESCAFWIECADQPALRKRQRSVCPSGVKSIVCRPGPRA